MKKWIVPAALVLMLALAACAPACVSERAPAGGESSGAGETTGTQVLSDGEKALEELAEPPALTVSCGWDQITLSWSGNASWSKAGPDGEGETWIACGLHPLDSQEYPVLYTGIPAGAGQTEGGGVASLAPALTLAFEVQPTQVTLRRWPAEYVGRTQEGEDQAETLEAENGTVLLPGDGDCVYEICAQWGDVGSASYVFRTRPQTRPEPLTGLAELYCRALRDPWETDPGLNSGAELLAFDWTGCTGLTEREQEGVMETLGAELGLDTRRGTLEELAEEGLIRADPDSGFEEFPAGLLLTVEDSIEADGRHTFSLQKYRSSLGAYCFYDCTARQEGDGWSYAVGAEMIS